MRISILILRESFFPLEDDMLICFPDRMQISDEDVTEWNKLGRSAPPPTTSNRPNSPNVNDLIGMMGCTSSSMTPPDLSPSTCSPIQN
jgi:hypothetical protein